MLIPCIGPLIRYEVERQAAASPILDHRIAFSYRFNPRLRDRTFHHSAYEESILHQSQSDVGEKVSRFNDVATSVSVWCPSLKSVCGEALKIACEDLKGQACRDPEVIRMIYRDISPVGFPPASLLGPSWALFRWVQAKLLFSLDHIGRYGISELPNVPRRIEHDIHDIEYLLFGALCGALATRDKDIGVNFLLCCPEGKLVQ